MPIVPWPAITSGSSNGWTKVRPALGLELEGVRVGVGVAVAVQHDLGAEGADGVDLERGRGHRHDDQRPAAELARGERDALGMVAGRGADHAARQLLRREVRHLVVGAAQLEAEHRLRVLALEQHLVAEPGREARRRRRAAISIATS